MLDMFTSNMHKHKCTVRTDSQLKLIWDEKSCQEYLHTTQIKKYHRKEKEDLHLIWRWNPSIQTSCLILLHIQMIHRKTFPLCLTANASSFFFLLHSQCTYFGQYITGTKITSICTISLGSRLEGPKVPKYIYTLSIIQTIYSQLERPFTIEIVDISYRQFMLSDPTMDYMRCFTFIFSKNSPE